MGSNYACLHRLSSFTQKSPDFKSGGFVAFVSAFFSRTAGIAMLALCAYPINFDLSRA